MDDPQCELGSLDTIDQTVDRSIDDQADLEAAARALGRRLGQVDRIRPPDDPDPAIAVFGQIDTFAELITPAADLDTDDTWPGPMAIRASADYPPGAIAEQPAFGSAMIADESVELLQPSIVESVAERSLSDDLLDRLRRHRTNGLVAITIGFIAAVLASGMLTDSTPSILVDDNTETVAAPAEIRAGDPAGPSAGPASGPRGTLVVRRQPVSQGSSGASSDRSSGEVDPDAADDRGDPAPDSGTDRMVAGESVTDLGPTDTTTPGDRDPDQMPVTATSERPTSTMPSTSVRPAPTAAPAPSPTSTTPRPTSTAAPTTLRPATTTTARPTTTRPATTTTRPTTTTTRPTTTTATVQPAPAFIIPNGWNLVGVDVAPGLYLSRPIGLTCEMGYFDALGFPIATNIFLPGQQVIMNLISGDWIWLDSTCPVLYDRV